VQILHCIVLYCIVLA